jgi:hypothetical protein
MAYQNVGTPKFYIDYLSYSKAIGAGGTAKSPNDTGYLDGNLNSLIGLNPTSIVTHTPITAQTLGDIDFTLYDGVEDIFGTDKMWCGIFGHNFADDDYWWAVGGATNWEWAANLDPIVNTPTSFRTTTDYNGWSLFNCTGFSGSSGDFRLSFYNSENPEWDVKLGSVGLGKEYTMPHSPDLNLKLSYEYDGVKTIQTKGGSTLSNASYTKPADWGSAGAWQLGTNISNLRSGRRVWDLSFSYLSDSDIMPNLGVQNYEDDAEDILDGTDFFSQVWNRTMGGHLPFIFQPDGANADPKADGFAICRFDMKSLTYNLVANNVYNVKLKIRECW